MKINAKSYLSWGAGIAILLGVAGFVSFPAWQPMYLDYNDRMRFEALKNDGQALRDRLQATTSGAVWSYNSGCARSATQTIVCSVMGSARIPISTTRQATQVIDVQRTAFVNQSGFELTTPEGIRYPNEGNSSGGATFLHSGTGIDRCKLTYAINVDTKNRPYMSARFSCSAEARKFYYPEVTLQTV